MNTGTSISKTLADFLNRDLSEVKKIVATMGIKDLMDVIHGIDNNDKDLVFRIYSGYTL